MYPYLLLVAFSSLYELIFIHFLQFNSDKWATIYLLFEFSVLSLVFSKNAKKWFKYVCLFFVLLFLMSFVYLSFIIKGNYELKVYGLLAIIEFFLIIFFSIYWFVSVFKSKEVESLLQLPLFYFISGLLIYHSGTIFLFMLSEEILHAGLSLQRYWIVNLILLFVNRIFLIVSIWKGRVI